MIKIEIEGHTCNVMALGSSDDVAPECIVIVKAMIEVLAQTMGVTENCAKFAIFEMLSNIGTEKTAKGDEE